MPWCIGKLSDCIFWPLWFWIIFSQIALIKSNLLLMKYFRDKHKYNILYSLHNLFHDFTGLFHNTVYKGKAKACVYNSPQLIVYLRKIRSPVVSQSVQASEIPQQTKNYNLLLAPHRHEGSGSYLLQKEKRENIRYRQC